MQLVVLHVQLDCRKVFSSGKNVEKGSGGNHVHGEMGLVGVRRTAASSLDCEQEVEDALICSSW